MLRIGMLTPSSNTCLEPVTYQILHDTNQATAHFARIPVTRIALDESSGAQFATEPMLAAARLLADAQVDVIAWNGTAGSWLGLEHDRALCAEIEKATGIPATTTTLGLIDACRAYGVTRLGLAVPYTREVTERITAVYADTEIECVAAEHLGLSDNVAFARVPPERVRELIAAAAVDGAHAVAVMCTNVFGAPHAATLEPELGLPVFDSVAVTLWRSLDLLGGAPITGWGTLLDTGSLRARFQEILTDLLLAAGADRTTLRLDHGVFHVDLTAAEALRTGVRSIRRDPSLDQRRLNTVMWLEQHRKPLIQPHFRGDPTPPQALIEVYGVNAQMLGPLVRGGDMTGWLSVHSLRERDWSAADRAALTDAISRVHDALDGI